MATLTFENTRPATPTTLRWGVKTAALAALLVAGCSASTAPSVTAATSDGAGTPSLASDADLRAAVKAYSDAFLVGDGPGSYAVLSARCQARNDPQDWNFMVSAAGLTYGKALEFTSFDATVSGEFARVTYTYDLSEIDQDSEPWVFENGAWREDDC